MFFTVKTPQGRSIYKYISYIKMMAIRIVAYYPIKSEEYRLNTFLEQKYKMGLKACCLKILRNCKYMISNNYTIEVFIRDPELDKLAQLITYGTDEIFGSQILIQAFKAKPL